MMVMMMMMMMMMMMTTTTTTTTTMIMCECIGKYSQTQLLVVFDYILHIAIFVILYNTTGALGGVVVKALRYKPAGRGFDSR
jgi:hypothetical protein